MKSKGETVEFWHPPVVGGVLAGLRSRGFHGPLSESGPFLSETLSARYHY